MVVEQLTGPVAEHGEGPIWDPISGQLRFVDIASGAILVLTADGIQRLPQPEPVTVMRPRRGGGWVLGTGSGFALAGPDGRWEHTMRLWDDPRHRMNDGGCDPQGRFYCGSMSTDFTPGAGTLYRLDPDLVVTRVLSGLTVPNGLCWRPDGRHAYFVDSPDRTIDLLLLDDDGSLAERRTLVRLPDDEPVPDGLTVDEQGGIWVAVYGSGQVRRYDPDGALGLVVEIGVPKPTACTFGGPDLADLYVTSTQEDVDLIDHPESGALFRVRIDGVRGLPTRDFAG